MRNSIFIYNNTETQFNNNGLGSLSDYISATVSEEINGAYEMEMKYPVTGSNYNAIALRRILLTHVCPDNSYYTQPFRIYYISEPTDGIVTIKARHISYDLSGIPVGPFYATSLNNAATALNNSVIVQNPFTFSNIRIATGNINIEEPTSYRSILGGMEGSILDVYGGEYEFDRFTVKLLSKRGQNSSANPFLISDRQNLTKFENVHDSSSTCSGVLGYWKSTNEDGQIDKLIIGQPTYITGSEISSVNDSSFVETIDLTEQFETEPTVAQINAAAVSYAHQNGHHLFNKNVKFSFADDSEITESLCLGDYVKMKYPRYSAEAVSRIIKTTFDVGKNCFSSIEIGSVRANISSTISESISNEIKKNNQSLAVQSISIRKELELAEDSLRAAMENNEGQASELRQAIDTISATVASINNSLSLSISDQTAMLSFISAVNSRIDSSNAALNERTQLIERYIKFIDGSIVIAVAGGKIKLKLFNDTIAFFDGADDETDMSNAFAKFTNNELSVRAIQCGKYITVGTHWRWLERQNSHFSLMKV